MNRKAEITIEQIGLRDDTSANLLPIQKGMGFGGWENPRFKEDWSKACREKMFLVTWPVYRTPAGDVDGVLETVTLDRTRCAAIYTVSYKCPLTQKREVYRLLFREAGGWPKFTRCLSHKSYDELMVLS